MKDQDLEDRVSSPRNQKGSGGVHLPGLNAVRFYAAISVVIAHTSNNFGELRTRPALVPLLNLIAMDAQSAVSLFFVLSGFLITYLMLQEQSSTGGLEVLRFYIRRALRIWPLYYVTVLIGFLLLPRILSPEATLLHPLWRSVFLVVVFLPNFVTGLGPLGHLWSIGLEEQFYVAWPWVLRRRGALVRVALGVILIKIMIAPAIAYLNVDSITNLYFGLRFECMAIGALGAFLYHGQHWLMQTVYSRLARLIAVAIVAFVAIVDVPLSEPGIIVTSTAFVILLLNLSTGPTIGRNLDTPILDAMGRISYGIYMYHYPTLYFFLRILNGRGVQEGPTYTALLYASTIATTLLLAALSYHWFERPFLALKSRYAQIQAKP